MDKGTAYPALGRVTEAQAATAGNAASAVAPTVKVHMGSKQAARAMRVNYKAQLSASGTTTPVAMPRPVVSLERIEILGRQSLDRDRAALQSHAQFERLPQPGQFLWSAHDVDQVECRLGSLNPR